ncbi:MAG: ATP synthase F1 subunit delta [Bacteroidales bacterium]
MPPESQILHKRYARALLMLAGENEILEQSYADMRLVDAVLNGHKELSISLKSPIVRVSKKQNVIRRLFDGRINPLILQFMLIIVRKQRGNILGGIASAYRDVYKNHMGIETVRIVTAQPLDEKLRKRAMAAAKKLTSYAIEFEESIDPDIIGGFILILGDKRYDASVRNRLNQAKKHLGLKKVHPYD